MRSTVGIPCLQAGEDVKMSSSGFIGALASFGLYWQRLQIHVAFLLSLGIVAGLSLTRPKYLPTLPGLASTPRQQPFAVLSKK